MAYDGSLIFDTKIDTAGFKSGTAGLKKMATGAGIAVAAALGTALKQGMSFESQMSTVKAISGATASEMELLSEKAKEMGAKTVFSASESGKAFEYMAMAGWKTEDMLGGISGVMNLAAASGEDLGLVSDIVTDALTAFGLKASDSSHFADVLAKASSNANTNVAMMGETFKFAAPLAGALGYSVEDVALATGLMANSGIKASQAGTSLRGIFTRLTKPTKQSASAMEKLGVTIKNADGSVKPFRELLIDLRAGFEKLAPAEKASTAAALGGQNAMSGLLAIVNASEADFNKLANAVDNADGAVDEMSETRLDNLQGDLTILGSAAEGLAISFYEGIKNPLREAVQSGTEGIGELTAKINGGELSGAVASIGDVLGSAVSFAVDMLPSVINGLSMLLSNAVPIAGAFLTAKTAIIGYHAASSAASIASTLLGGGLTALLNPVGLVGAGIGLAAAAVVGISAAAKQAEQDFFNMGETLKTTAQAYDEAKSKAELTEDYAQQWRDLNSVISDGKLSAGELAAAEGKRKEIEDWFIQNYGSYISAEEQKNGIRADTIGRISETVAQLSEQKRLELEIQALQMGKEIPDLTEEINGLVNKNKALDDQNTKLLQQQLDISKAQAAWGKLTDEQQMSADGQKIMNELLDDLNAKYDKAYSGMLQLDSEYEDISNTIADNNKAIEENSGKIEAGTKSVQTYVDTCRQLAETELGATLEDFAAGFETVKKAQQEVQDTGKVSEETFKALIEKFPEMEAQLQGAADGGAQALNDKMTDLQGKLDSAKSKANDLGVELNGLPKNIDIFVTLHVPEMPSFASGTRGAHEGPAIVNDGSGPELIQSKKGSFRMIASKGSALTWLNSGDRVYTAEQTRAMLRHTPRYANGIGVGGGYEINIKSYTKKIPEQVQKAFDELELKRDLDVIDEAEYYSQLAELRDKYFSRDSKEWWDYYKKDYEYQKKLVKKQIDDLKYKHDKSIISEEDYYIQLNELRDKYYIEGSEEWQAIENQNYEHTEELIDKEFEKLQKALSRGIISEQDYYSQLADMRDKYYAAGSEKWQEYTDKITDYYAGRIKGIKDEIKQLSDTIKNNLIGNFQTVKLETVTVKATGKTQIAGLNPNGNYTGADRTYTRAVLGDLEEQKKKMEIYSDTLTKLSEVSELSNSFRQYLLSLSLEEGFGLASSLLAMSDEDRRQYLSAWDDIQSFAESRANEMSLDAARALYSDDVQEVVTDAAKSMGNDFIDILAQCFATVPADYYRVGAEIAASFADGFDDKIASLRDSGFFGALISGDSYYDNRSTTIIAGTTSAHDIIEAQRQRDIYDSHTRGWN